MTERRKFNTFVDAFAYCRRKDAPVVVLIRGVRWKLYPSGGATNLDRVARHLATKDPE